jgi:hypothetical protein
MDVCKCCVLSGRDLCEGLSNRSEVLRSVACFDCNIKASIMKKPRPTLRCCAIKKHLLPIITDGYLWLQSIIDPGVAHTMSIMQMEMGRTRKPEIWKD